MDKALTCCCLLLLPTTAPLTRFNDALPLSATSHNPRRSMTMALVLSMEPFRRAVAVSSSEHAC